MAVGLAKNLGIQENPWVFSIVGIVLIEAVGGKFGSGWKCELFY